MPSKKKRDDLSFLWHFPHGTEFGKFIPKKKIYEQSGCSPAVRALFVAEVDKITWSHKLAPELMNIQPSDDVPEIQIITIEQKGETLSPAVVAAIDDAIPFPVIFKCVDYGPGKEWRDATTICYQAALKTKPSAGRVQWGRSAYMISEWADPRIAQYKNVPTAVSMADLYHEILATLLPISRRPAEPIAEAIERWQVIDALERQIKAQTKKMHAEKQFKRKTEMNAAILCLNSSWQHCTRDIKTALRLADEGSE